MKKFLVLDTPIKDLKIIQRKPISDSRGFLTRLFCANELHDEGWSTSIAQINHTFTKKRGAVRGMHFQNAPHAEMKLVTCLSGEVWDVAVDLRHNSPTFLNWHAEKLTPENCRSFLIPEGFAHGFQALTDNCELLYLHSSAYVPEAEAGLCPTDSKLGILWPLDFSELSQRDAQHPLITDHFKGIQL